MVQTDDIILAISSPPGRSLRGIIRASGAQTLKLLALVTVEPVTTPDHGIRACRVQLCNGELPAMCLTFPEGRSYTGEASFEIQLPGNPVLLDRAVDELIRRGSDAGMSIRRADAGEFTARAFFHDCLSLTEAEGVAHTIAARSDAELAASQELMHGALGRFATALADDLAEALALVEAGIDFTDQEDVVAIAPGDLLQRLRELRQRISGRLERSEAFENLEAIPWVVLTGPPNAGKSTLFNRLLGRDRAVVSTVAGTTRDVIAEPLHIRSEHGLAEVMLVDIAGADAADLSTVNRQMQRAAEEARRRAELLLLCIPADGNAGADDNIANVSSGDQRTVRILTKIDNAPAAVLTSDSKIIPVSAVTDDGIEQLKATIADRLAGRAVSLSADVMALAQRHEAALRDAACALDEAVDLTTASTDQRHLQDAELIASAMLVALDHLADLAGEMTPDDVLGRIFATFCVGK